MNDLLDLAFQLESGRSGNLIAMHNASFGANLAAKTNNFCIEKMLLKIS